ncbi:hypothetical protein EVAR_42576_1 [Eumeta japonica]|uniref:Uncharacterized protein n=1 Tax=Eumeta variegata TaxID=151549 RepID=A0A4C1ZWQ0_EUMVA|nr:hypothetical protein EVAR_42576_1 [Eumeta japonica]
MLYRKPHSPLWFGRYRQHVLNRKAGHRECWLKAINPARSIIRKVGLSKAEMNAYSRSERADEPSESRLSPPPMDSRNLRGVTDALPASLNETGYLMEGAIGTGPPEPEPRRELVNHQRMGAHRRPSIPASPKESPARCRPPGVGIGYLIEGSKLVNDWTDLEHLADLNGGGTSFRFRFVSDSRILEYNLGEIKS